MKVKQHTVVSQSEQIRAGAGSYLNASSEIMYGTGSEEAFSSCFSFLFMSSETVEQAAAVTQGLIQSLHYQKEWRVKRAAAAVQGETVKLQLHINQLFL